MKPFPFWPWLRKTILAYTFFNWFAPIFAKPTLGQLENGQQTGVAPRLPSWLSDYDTPDNGLTGDSAFKETHPNGTYFDMVAWLYRNTLYGWQVKNCAEVIGVPRIVTGNININYHTGVCGFLDITAGEYWQHKEVTPLKWFPSYCKVINKGWNLDNLDNQTPMLVNSYRFRKLGTV